MALMGTQRQDGLFVNPDAMSAKDKKVYAKLLADVLKVGSDQSIVLANSLMISNPLTPEMGTTAKFYNWGQLTAMLKQDGVPTPTQKILPGDFSRELHEYETKVGITGRAKINGQMDAQTLLNSGQAGRAFARAIDAQGLTEIQTGGTISIIPGGKEWSAGGATDAEILAQIAAELKALRVAGFIPGVMLLDTDARQRLVEIGLGIGNGISFNQLLSDFIGIPKAIVIEDIVEVLPDGTDNTLFDAFDNVMIMDPSAFGVYSDRPTTLETVRDAHSDIDFAIMRKYFESMAVQPTACQILNNTNL